MHAAQVIWHHRHNTTHGAHSTYASSKSMSSSYCTAFSMPRCLRRPRARHAQLINHDAGQLVQGKLHRASCIIIDGH